MLSPALAAKFGAAVVMYRLSKKTRHNSRCKNGEVSNVHTEWWPCRADAPGRVSPCCAAHPCPIPPFLCLTSMESTGASVSRFWTSCLERVSNTLQSMRLEHAGQLPMLPSSSFPWMPTSLSAALDVPACSLGHSTISPLTLSRSCLCGCTAAGCRLGAMSSSGCLRAGLAMSQALRLPCPGRRCARPFPSLRLVESKRPDKWGVRKGLSCAT